MKQILGCVCLTFLLTSCFSASDVVVDEEKMDDNTTVAERTDVSADEEVSTGSADTVPSDNLDITDANTDDNNTTIGQDAPITESSDETIVSDNNATSSSGTGESEDDSVTGEFEEELNELFDLLESDEG